MAVTVRLKTPSLYVISNGSTAEASVYVNNPAPETHKGPLDVNVPDGNGVLLTVVVSKDVGVRHVPPVTVMIHFTKSLLAKELEL